jgi:hypothetical protein
MSNKNPKNNKKVSEEDLKKHNNKQNKNIVEKDNALVIKPKLNTKNQIIKKDSGSNIHRDEKGNVVIKNEKGVYETIKQKPKVEIKQGSKKTSEQYKKEQEVSEDMQSNNLGLRAPLHYLSNPDHFLGDLGNLTGFKPLQEFSNSDEDAKRYNFQSSDPSKSQKERFKDNLTEGLNLTPSAALNLALGQAASKSTLQALKQAYNPIPLPFSVGMKHNPTDYWKGIENRSDTAELLNSSMFSSSKTKDQIYNKLVSLQDHIVGINRGIEDINSGRPIFETFPITKKQRLNIENKQNLALKEADDFVKEWNYPEGSQTLRPEVQKRISDLYNTKDLYRSHFMDDPSYNNFNLNSKSNPISNTKSILVGSRTNQIKNSELSDTTKNYLYKNKNTVAGINSSGADESITLRGKGLWYSDPSDIKRVAIHENSHTMQRLGALDSNFGEQLAKLDFENPYYKANDQTVIGSKFKDAMVQPKPGEYLWEGSPNEIHSELMPAREALYSHWINKGLPKQQAMNELQNPSKETLDHLINLGNLNRFFKKTTSEDVKRNLIKALPAIGVTSTVTSNILNKENNKQTSQFALGGNLKQQTNNNMLNEFNEGGTHDQNPLGGIPQGMGQNGQMNTVEEGETKKDSFVYSNRIVLTPEVVAQFNLPKSLTGKTVADATKLINNKFEGRNSQIDNSTKKNFLDRIAEAQETIKAEEQAKIAESMQVNSQEVPDMMGGQIPQGMEEFMQPQQQMAYGGKLRQNQMFFGGDQMMQDPNQNQGSGMGMGNLGSMFSGIGNSLNAYSQQRDASKLPEGYVDKKGQQDQMNNQLIDSTKDTVSKAFGPIGGLFRGIQKTGQGIGNTIGGDAGAAVSGIFSPEEGMMSAMTDKDLSIGQKALATIPGVGGVIAKKQADKRLNKWRFEKDTFEANSKISDFAFGGNLGDPTKDPKLTQTSTKTSTIVDDNDPRVKRFNDASGVQFTADGVNSLMRDRNPVTSQYKRIYNIQTGVTGKDGVEGVYYYYGDRNKGFNPETDRDFIPMKTHNELMSSKDPNYVNPYIRKYHELTGGRNNMQVQYGEGGNMYNDGGSFGKSMASYDAAKINPLQSLDNNVLKGLSGLNRGVYNDPYKDRIISLTPEQLNQPSGWHEKPSIVPENTTTSEQTKMGKTLSKTGEFMKDNYGNMLRYAPVAMNAYQLAKMGKPEVENLDRLRNKYNPQYMDERALTNQINAEMNNTATGLAGTSGGSLGALRNNLLGMQLNKTKALSDAYSKIADVNRNEDKTAQQFNLGVDQFNVGQSNQEKDINAANRAAYRREKSKLLGQIGTDLGDIGKETVYKKLAKEAFGYTWDGEYVRNDKGEVVKNPDTGKPLTQEDLKKSQEYAQKFKTMSQKDFGSLSLNNKKYKE